MEKEEHEREHEAEQEETKNAGARAGCRAGEVGERETIGCRPPPTSSRG